MRMLLFVVCCCCVQVERHDITSVLCLCPVSSRGKRFVSLYLCKLFSVVACQKDVVVVESRKPKAENGKCIVTADSFIRYLWIGDT